MNAIEFRRLIKHRSIRMFRPKIVVGGFGSWQLERKNRIDGYNIDCVLIGGKRETIVDIFRKAVNDNPLPNIIRDKDNGYDTESEDPPLIKHAAIHGAVEISKGCGRNCQFCTPTMQSKNDIPLDSIMEEVKTTMMEGGSNITLVTEDLFLYGAEGKQFTPNKSAVVKLVQSIADHPGVEGIQPSHISLAPVVNNPGMVREVAEILIEHNWYFHDKKPIVTSETGIETGSVRLMKKYMASKMLPYKPEQWREVIIQAFGILNDYNWYPLATLIIGLPQENEEDVIETLELMDNLKDYNAFYVPLFFVPLENSLLMHKKGAEIDSLTKKRWELLIRCWEYNIRIWRDTFLEQRISNPLIFNATKKMLIPYIARTISIYYGMKHGQQMKQALWKMATT